MTYTTRDSSWEMIAPGLYLDPGGEGHIFPDEVLATLGFPYTLDNYRIVIEAFRQLCVEMRPDLDPHLRIITHNRRPDA